MTQTSFLKPLRELWTAWGPAPSLEEIARRFRASGADGEEERVRRWLAPDTAPPPDLREELSRLLALLERFEGPSADSLKVAIMVSLGRFREAADLIDPGFDAAEPFVWRAEAEFASGRSEEARENLYRALQLAPEDTKALCLSGLARFLAGDPASALSLLAQAAELGDAVACGLAGYLTQRTGDAEAARRAVERAVALRPKAAWPLALRALVYRLAQDIEGIWRQGGECPGPAADPDFSPCLADLDLALEREPAVWILRLRAECREKMVHMGGAIADLDRALALNGPNPFLHAQRGHCLFNRKRYDEAAADFSEAIRLLPGKAVFLWERANACWLAGRLKEAYEDALACVRLDAAASYGLGLARFQILSGEENTARESLEIWAQSSDSRMKAGAKFLLGFIMFRDGRYAEALVEFEAAEKLGLTNSRPEPWAQAGFSELALGFQFLKSSREGFMPEKARASGTLIIAGLGLHYPHQATLEVLKALRACDVVFSNLAGTEAMEFLGLFCRDVRTVSYEGDSDPEIWADKIFSALGPGITAAFVTRGHPLISGHLAQCLIDRARREGVEVRSYGAVSSYDTVLALAGMTTSETFWGLQVYDSRLVVDKDVAVQTNLPLILEVTGRSARSETDWVRPHITELAGSLQSFYPSSHWLFLYGPRYESRRLERVVLGEMESRLSQVPPEFMASMLILVPPVKNLIPRVYPRPGRRAAARGT